MSAIYNYERLLSTKLLTTDHWSLAFRLWACVPKCGGARRRGQRLSGLAGLGRGASMGVDSSSLQLIVQTTVVWVVTVRVTIRRILFPLPKTFTALDRP